MQWWRRLGGVGKDGGRMCRCRIFYSGAERGLENVSPAAGKRSFFEPGGWGGGGLIFAEEVAESGGIDGGLFADGGGAVPGKPGQGRGGKSSQKFTEKCFALIRGAYFKVQGT